MKGLSKTLEAFIAMFVILTVFFIFFSSPIELPEFTLINERLKVLESLKKLDISSNLREYALKNQTKKIEDLLADYIPFGTNYKVQICEAICKKIEIPSERITTVSYYISGSYSKFKPLQIVVYLWK